MPLRAVIASLLLAVFCVSANAATVAYAEAFDTLYAVDLSTRSASPIGPAGSWGGTALSNVAGLTVAPNGQLYAVTDTLLKALVTIDRSTGAATVVGPLGGDAGLGDTGQGAFNVLDLGLSFTCDGRLWLSSAATGSFWQVDPATAAVTKVGNLGAKITGLTARGNQLYGAGSQSTPSLYRIDVGNAHATAIGSYGPGIDPITTTSPGFDASGKLWSILDDVPPLPPQNSQPQWSSLATLDTAGAMTILGDITTPAGLKYPSNATQLPYVGLKGLAIASPCSIAAPLATDTAPSLSAAGLSALILLLVALAGTSPALRRRSC
jgi:hypothetical protein